LWQPAGARDLKITEILGTAIFQFSKTSSAINLPETIEVNSRFLHGLYRLYSR